MNWNQLESQETLERIKKESFEEPILLFKHSTRCSISSTALARLERAWKNNNIKPYYLDLLTYRPISNQIASDFGIEHQSPQALLIKDGKCIYYASHYDISVEEMNGILEKN